ncbi:MAG: beta-lactamase family protein, partial [Planctomycetes bacterium]|nr:beta-lactamase family protein [Planctomycetota bacterium]
MNSEDTGNQHIQLVLKCFSASILLSNHLFCSFIKLGFLFVLPVFVSSKEIIKNHVTSGKSPGISVGLINESGIQTFNYGEIEKKSNIEPTADTVFEIGSMTKTFTATLAVQLQQEGILSLDEP